MRLGLPSSSKCFLDIPRACGFTIVTSAKERVTNLWNGVNDCFNSTWNGCSSAIRGTGNFLDYHANRAPHNDAEAAASLAFWKECVIDAASYVEGKSKPHINPLLVNVATSTSFAVLLSWRPEVFLAKFAYRWVLPPSVALTITAVLISGYARSTYKPSKEEALAEPIILFRKGQRMIGELFTKTEPQENSPSLIENKSQIGKKFFQKAIEGDLILFKEHGGETSALQTSLVVAELTLLYFAGFSTPTLADQAFWNTIALNAISSAGTYFICQIGKKEPAALPIQQIDSNLVYRGES